MASHVFVGHSLAEIALAQLPVRFCGSWGIFRHVHKVSLIPSEASSNLPVSFVATDQQDIMPCHESRSPGADIFPVAEAVDGSVIVQLIPRKNSNSDRTILDFLGQQGTVLGSVISNVSQ